MPRVSLQTAKELPHGAEVVLSPELWEVVLGQLQPELQSPEHDQKEQGEITGTKQQQTSRRIHQNGKTTAQYERVAVAITRKYKLESTRITDSQSPISTLVCWACLDSLQPSAQQQDKGKGKSKVQLSTSLRTSARLRKRYPDLLGLSACTLDIRPTRPIELSQVFLLARDTSSYEYASQNEENLQSLLARDGRILRQNEVIELAVPSSTLSLPNGMSNGHTTNNTTISYQVTLTEPVLQGYITEGNSEIIVLPPLVADNIRQKQRQSSNANANGEWHVDEDFLAREGLDDPTLHHPPSHSILPDHLTAGVAGSTSSTWQSPLSSPSMKSAQLDASILSVSEHNTRINNGSLVRVMACSRYVDDGDLSPTPEVDEDEHMRAFVRASDLAKLGLFSGDKVEIQGLASESKRIVKVYGLRRPLPTPDSDLWLLLSPILLHNMGNPSIIRLNPIKKQHNTTTKTGSLRNGSENLRRDEFEFPIAKAISIARIASEHSMQKKYQPLFISALKEYFKISKRILKQGDLIAIPIDASKSLFLFREGENGNGNEIQDEGQDFELPNAPSSPTAVAYFSVAKLDVPGDVSATGIASGKYGCHIDPSTTTMVQTGLTNTPVPNAFGYLGIAGAPADNLLQASPHGQENVASRLMDFVKASSMKHTSELNINLTVLLKGARGSGKATLVRQVSQLSGFHLLELDCYEILGDTDTKTEGNLAARFDRAASCTPCILLLRHIEALARKSQVLETGQEPTIASTFQDCLKVAQEARKTTGYPLILVGTTSDVDKIPLSVLGLFKEEFAIEAPAEAERLELLQNMLASEILSPDVSVKSLAVQTAALVASDLADLCERARKGAVARLLEKQLSINDCQYAGVSLTAADFTSALDHARSSYSESIGAPKIPNVTWDDVGGLAKVKTEILDTIQLPLQHPELFEEGLKKRSGVLLYGPPGTGKTLLAKAVATSCSLNFFSVKGPELLNMYIGESEANVRRVFQRARDAKPCVIFFDELDSVAPKRGNQGDSGGVMDRIVSQLLAELDGMSEGKGGADVFVIGATNRPDLLDPALLRPGRFDRMLYLGVSDNHDSQLKIIEALTRKFKLEPECNLSAIAQQCPFNYTGADFYALCSDALLKAMSRKAEAVDARIAELNLTSEYARNPLTPQYYLAELAQPEEMQVTVSQQDFELALKELVPSVSEAEMLHYKVVQQRFNPEKQEEMAVDRKGKGKARAL